MIINGNALHIPLADKTVQCVITSPPYWGLRDYGTAKWEGGDSDCDHKGKPMATKAGFNERYTGKKPINTDKQSECLEFYKDICGKCGAHRIDAQLGLEKTPEEYVANMVSVFREVWRVLKDDGVLWLNLGDSYASSAACERRSTIGAGSPDKTVRRANRLGNGLKNKDLVGIPWMVAFALRADGWYLRQDIIWHKPNPMPESVKDRCTKSHEYIFLLTKSAKYFYNNDAIREPQAKESLERLKRGWNGNGDRGYPGGPQNHIKNYMGKTQEEVDALPGRNRRSVWTVTTKPYRGAHFATFPPDLVEPMVLAGSRKGDIVLDPFSGTSTVKIVSVKHERRYAGLELSMDYIRLAKQRARGIQVQMM